MAKITDSSAKKTTFFPFQETDKGREQGEQNNFLEVFMHAHQLTKSGSINQIINQMLDLMVKLCDAKLIMFYLLDGGTDEMVIISTDGEMANPSFIGLRFNRELGILGKAAQDHQPVLAGDFVETQHWLNAIDPNYATKLNNYLTFPLYYKDTYIGAVQVFNYLTADLDFLNLLGDYFIQVLGERISRRLLINSNQKLRHLIDVLQQIAGNLDRDKLLHLVTENASQLVNAERSSIFLADTENPELNFQVSYQSTDEVNHPTKISNEETIIHMFKSIIQDLNRDETSNCTSVIKDEGFGFFTKSAITVPLKTITADQPGKTKVHQTIGGLMVLNKLYGDFSHEDNQLLRILASQASTFLQIADIFENANDLFLGVVKSMVTAIDAKDPYTQGHSLRVSEISVAIAQELKLSENFINNIRVGSLLHDIGKIGTPDHILKKKGALTAREFDEIKIHTVVGHNIMRQSLALQPVLPAILSHHERLDGSGYPYGLKGSEIPLMSRIVAVADVFDAMASERPYRPGKPINSILDYLKISAGSLLDQDCVGALIDLVDRGFVSGLYQDHKTIH